MHAYLMHPLCAHTPTVGVDVQTIGVVPATQTAGVVDVGVCKERTYRRQVTWHSTTTACAGAARYACLQGSLPAATPPTEIQSMLSAQITTGTASSPVSSHSGHDSMGSVNWHGLEPLSNSITGNPSFGAMPPQHRGSRMAPHGASSHSSSNMPCSVGTPEMPQHNNQYQQQQQHVQRHLSRQASRVCRPRRPHAAPIQGQRAL
jgi:hypothetical protein